AEANGSAYAFVVFDGELYAIAVAPLLAPDPIAWLCPMFRIDDDFAREIQSYTNLEITFLNGAQLFGTTLPNRQAVTEMLRNRTLPPKQLINLPLSGEIFTSYVAPLLGENGKPIALLQRSLDKELAPYLRLERTYLGLALLGLALSAFLWPAWRWPVSSACGSHAASLARCWNWPAELVKSLPEITITASN